MKLSTLLVALSLAVNVVLLAVLAMGAFSSGPAVVTSASAAAPAVARASPEAASGAWTELQTSDLAQQAERLRAEGFPPKLVRTIIAAQIRAGFAARRKALDAAAANQPFWLVNVDPALQAEQAALSREEQKAVRAVLGPDPENGTLARLQRSMPHIAADKLELVAEIRDRYDEKRSEIYAAVRTFTGDDQAKIDALDKAAHQEIAGVLSASELEDYDLRQSRVATTLRNNLGAFDPSEQEFRALFRLQSAFDEQYGRPTSDWTQEQFQARSDAQKGLNEQIKAALGDARYADYQRDTDYNYRRVNQLVARLNLPAETAKELYALQQSTQERVAEIRRSAPPTTANLQERQEQLRAIASDAEAKIAAKLGPAGLEAYKQYGGSWLNNIAPRPPAPKQ